MGLGTKIALENTGPNFSVGWTARPTDNIAVYRRYASVCAIRTGVQSQARPPWPAVTKISLTGTSSTARPGLPSQRHMFPHVSQIHTYVSGLPSQRHMSPHVSQIHTYVSGLPSQRHMSPHVSQIHTYVSGLPSQRHMSPHVSQIHTYVSGTSVSGIRRGLPLRGPPSRLSVSGKTVCTIPLGFPTRGHPTPTVRLTERHPSAPSVSGSRLGVRLVAISRGHLSPGYPTRPSKSRPDNIL